jgi:hypothetical protein
MPVSGKHAENTPYYQIKYKADYPPGKFQPNAWAVILGFIRKFMQALRTCRAGGSHIFLKSG